MGRPRYGVREEIREAVDSLYRALSNKSLKTIDRIWCKEPYAVVAGPTGQLQQGWPAIRQFWDQRFKQLADQKVSARLNGMVYHAVGDVAWLSGRECRTVTAGNESWDEELRVTCVLERQGTGWLIVSYHASLPAQAEDELASAS